jgi:phosphatidylglycerol:prolipoprotein diacylglycerol transferase
MEFQSDLVVLFDTLSVRYYGIIIVTAMLVATAVAARLARRDGRNPDHIWGGLTWAIIPAIIGARLWFVLFPPASYVEEGLTTAYYFQNFFNLQNGAIAIWSGGLSIFGAVLGGLIGVWLYFSPLHNRVVRIFSIIFLPLTAVLTVIVWVPTAIVQRVRGKEIPPFKLDTGADSDFPAEGMPIAPWLDIAAVALPLGQAIGRWANFINQELYGVPTTLPWGITIDPAFRVAPYESLVEYPATTLFHPLFLYESLWSLLAFIVLLNLFLRFRHRLAMGDFFLLYIMQYAFIRFWLEGIRVEVAYIPGTTINIAQAVTVVAFLAALAVFVYRHRPGANYQPRGSDLKQQTVTDTA